MRYLPALVVFATTVALVIGPALAAPNAAPAAQALNVPLAAGDTLHVECAGLLKGTFASNAYDFACEAVAATLTPTATTSPTNTPSPTSSPTGTSVPTATAGPANVGRCGESNDVWHPPVIGSCFAQHEHGDAPPAWVATSGHPAMFTHDGNTPNENVLKHTSFKGYATRFNNQDVYVVMHLDTNPSGHSSRFHSVQVWIKDTSGAISHFDQWLEFGDGDNTGPTVRRFGCEDTDSPRPVFAVNARACNTPLRFENWYARPAGFEGNAPWMVDFGFNTAANYWAGGDPAVPATWDATGEGSENDNRRIEMAWYANRSGQRGSFYATQFGEIVTGPSDPKCSQSRTLGTRTYANLCIHQTIQPTLQTIQFPGNASQKAYPSQGVINPN
jgi:hypothetical protein